MAIKVWRGGASDVAQVTRITFSSYTTGYTYTVTCNGKDITYTAAADTIGDVVEGLVAAIQASVEPEFGDFTPTSSSGLLLTGITRGRPFTVAASVSTGTPTVTEVTAATGKNHFDNDDNWEGGSAPSASDDLVFKNNGVSVLYAIEDTTNYASMRFDSTFTGQVGLPAQSSDRYREYRPRFLKLGNGSSAIAITIGQGSGGQSSRIFIDGNDASLAVSVYSTGSPTDEARPVIIKNFDSASEFNIFGGSVLLDADSSATAASVNITPQDQRQIDVLCESTVACGAVIHSGGRLEVRGGATSIDASDGAQAYFIGVATCPTVKVATGARVVWASSAGITTDAIVYNGGTLDFSHNAEPKTVTDASVYQGGTWLDPLGVVTLADGLEMSGAKLGDVQVDFGRDKKIAVGSVNTGREVLDSENGDYNITSAITVLTDTPDATGVRVCHAAVFLGDGTKDLDGTGGDFEITITIGGASWGGGPDVTTVGTEVRAVIQTEEFIVPAGAEVVVKVLSPNAGDTDVDVTAYLMADN